MGFFSAPIDRRSDASRSVPLRGELVDSIRGGEGTFLPVPDTPIRKVTREEAQAYRNTAVFYQNEWQQMDPVLIGLRRTALDGQTERVQIQARMLPLNREKYGLLTELFGPPTKRRIKTPSNDIVSVQALVDGGSWEFPMHHLYFGLRDAAPNELYSKRRFLKSLQVMRTAPAYVAAWPKPGLLDAVAANGDDLGNGFLKLLMGLIRLDAPNGFSFLSFDQDILKEVAPLMETETVENPSQLHVHIGDIKNSKFGQWADGLDFQRGWETSVGNIHLMHLLTQQLHVPVEDAKSTAEQILNAQLICPLKGKYEVQTNDDGTRRWVSTAWIDGKKQSRMRYVSPLMSWLRGLELAITIEADRVVAEGTLDIDREKRAGGLKLPKFKLFGGS